MAGVFTVLPSGKRIKAAATIGAGISLLGVALFWYAYPAHWAGYGRQLTLAVTGIYFLGSLTSVWCLFVGIANFKQRNDPGGTVSLRITKESGETKVVEVEKSDLEDGSLGDIGGAGGIGVFGADPDGSVETQTNDPGSTAGPSGGTASGSAGSGTATGRAATGGTGGETTTGSVSGAAGGSGASPGRAGRDGVGSTGGTGGSTRSTGTDDGWSSATETTHPAQTGAASDGGADDRDIRSVDGEIRTPRESARQYADQYCGNCEHFQYVRTGSGMQPYCGFHGEEMDDMEACEQWEPNH